MMMLFSLSTKQKTQAQRVDKQLVLEAFKKGFIKLNLQGDWRFCLAKKSMNMRRKHGVWRKDRGQNQENRQKNRRIFKFEQYARMIAWHIQGVEGNLAWKENRTHMGKFEIRPQRKRVARPCDFFGSKFQLHPSVKDMAYQMIVHIKDFFSSFSIFSVLSSIFILFFNLLFSSSNIAMVSVAMYSRTG